MSSKKKRSFLKFLNILIFDVLNKNIDWLTTPTENRASDVLLYLLKSKPTGSKRNVHIEIDNSITNFYTASWFGKFIF